MDSKLVVEQMSGRWKVKHPDMQVLAKQAAALVRQLPAVRFTHIRREFNSHADRLANQAMDDQRGRPDRGSTAIRSAATTRRADEAARTRSTAGAAPAGSPTVATAAAARRDAAVGREAVQRSRRRRADRSRRGAGRRRGATARRAGHRRDRVLAAAPGPADRRGRRGSDSASTSSIEDGFAETDFGEWEGATFGEIGEGSPEALRDGSTTRPSRRPAGRAWSRRRSGSLRRGPHDGGVPRSDGRSSSAMSRRSRRCCATRSARRSTRSTGCT